MQSEETQSISAFSQAGHVAASSITNCDVMFSRCQQCPDVIEQFQHVANMKESANIYRGATVYPRGQDGTYLSPSAQKRKARIIVLLLEVLTQDRCRSPVCFLYLCISTLLIRSHWKMFRKTNLATPTFIQRSFSRGQVRVDSKHIASYFLVLTALSFIFSACVAEFIFFPAELRKKYKAMSWQQPLIKNAYIFINRNLIDFSPSCIGQ